MQVSVNKMPRSVEVSLAVVLVLKVGVLGKIVVLGMMGCIYGACPEIKN